MSQIKDLKTNKDNLINVVDFFELIIPDSKTKYYELLLRMFKNSIERQFDDKIIEAKSVLTTLFPEHKEDISKYSAYNTILMSYLFDLLHETKINIDTINKFIDYNERNLIPQNDITTYKSYDEIHNQVMFAELKVQEKELEKQVVKIFEDDNWLMLKPLTYESSVKYGYNTKWCTAMETDKSYFTRYANEGCLIYFINKSGDKKIAAYNKMVSGDQSITFWNEADKSIDSFTSGLPGYLLDLLREHYVKHPITNKTVLELLTKNDKKVQEPTALNDIERKIQDLNSLKNYELKDSYAVGMDSDVKQMVRRSDNTMMSESATPSEIPWNTMNTVTVSGSMTGGLLNSESAVGSIGYSPMDEPEDMMEGDDIIVSEELRPKTFFDNIKQSLGRG